MRRGGCAIAALGLLCLPGCGGSGPETIPVYGTVALEGRELPQVCRLYFLPIETSGAARPSIATMEKDGAYRAEAFRGADGLPPGKYQVNVNYYELKPGANPDLDASWIEHRHDAGEVVVEADSDGVELPISIPAKSEASQAVTFGSRRAG